MSFPLLHGLLLMAKITNTIVDFHAGENTKITVEHKKNLDNQLLFLRISVSGNDTGSLYPRAHARSSLVQIDSWVSKAGNWTCTSHESNTYMPIKTRDRKPFFLHKPSLINVRFLSIQYHHRAHLYRHGKC